MLESPEPRLVRRAQPTSPREVECAERVAVVAPPATDDDRALRLTVRQPVGAHHLERRLGRLGSSRDGIERRTFHRQERSQLFGPRLERIGSERAAVRICDRRRLFGRRLGNIGASVSDPDDDRTARGIQIASPRGVGDPGALAANRARQRCATAAEDLRARHMHRSGRALRESVATLRRSAPEFPERRPEP